MLSDRFLWPGMIGVALAVGLGVQMGESAIGSIDPIHFQGTAPPARGIDPGTPPPAQSAYAQAYGWEQGNEARHADGGTPAHEDFDYIPQAIVRPAAAPAWREPAAPVNLAPWPPGQVSSHPEVERYTDYPIEEKPIERPPADQPQPQPGAMPLSVTGK